MGRSDEGESGREHGWGSEQVSAGVCGMSLGSRLEGGGSGRMPMATQNSQLDETI